MKKRIYYFPIDISASILTESTKRLKSQFPNASIVGIRSDYATGIDTAAVKGIAANGEGSVEKRKNNNYNKSNNDSYQYAKLILFLGSSIGNFEPMEAISFLRSIKQKLSTKDFLLIGFDLQKDESVLNAAYNDRAGITAKFNLNLIARINRELGGNCELGKFKHHAFYNREQHRIEMHLVSNSDQQVHIEALGKKFSFRKGDSIHTENSYKYSLDQIAALAMDSGFRIIKDFTDEKKWFNISLLSPS